MAKFKDTNLSNISVWRTRQYKSYTWLSKGLGQSRTTVSRNASEEIMSRPAHWCMSNHNKDIKVVNIGSRYRSYHDTSWSFFSSWSCFIYLIANVGSNWHIFLNSMPWQPPSLQTNGTATAWSAALWMRHWLASTELSFRTLQCGAGVDTTACLYSNSHCTTGYKSPLPLTDPRDAVPHAHRTVHMWTVSVINWWPTTVTSLSHSSSF